MKTLNPYLTFAGNCREALEFYRDSLKGEIISLQTFGEAQMPGPEAIKDRVIHAEFRADDVYFMASDGMADYVAVPGNMVSMSLDFKDEQEQEAAFNALSAGGKVNMPLERTFWGAKFGMLTDKFGIQWFLNCTMPGGSPA